jgi:exopolyphosphatase / guanosine-5'-triphosphate,3'-diphosphate pyrophosphatase
MDEDAADTLSWAARLHELGLSISHAGYHKHGAYLLANADLAGYSRQDQQPVVAPGAEPSTQVSASKLIPESVVGDMQFAPGASGSVLLRLAVLLCSSRSDTPPAVPQFSECHPKRTEARVLPGLARRASADTGRSGAGEGAI